MDGLSYKELLALYTLPIDHLDVRIDEEWFQVLKIREEGEKKAHKHIADWFRALADHVEKGGWPLIYGCNIPSRVADVPAKGQIGERFEITFSHPWGG